MAETLFAFDRYNYQNCQSSFRGERGQEYYLGDYSISNSETIDVRAEKKAVGPSSIIRLRSRTHLSFRRSWSHIRQDAIDVTVLWFVKRGRMVVTNQCGQSTAEAGHFVITRSMTPFSVECQTDDEGVYEVLHVTVPTYIVRKFIPDDILTGFTLSTEGRDFALADHILSNIFEDDGELAEETARLLVDSSLSVLSHAIKARHISAPSRQSVSSRRFQEVLRFIETHLSDPHLNVAMVAKGCGISTRYLSFLLTMNGTTFSSLMWGQRIESAKLWMLSSKAKEVSLGEIAYSVGFKSPAHFSRMFKQMCNMNPSEFRKKENTCINNFQNSHLY